MSAQDTRILVVSDDAGYRDRAASELRAEGYEVIVAGSSKDAREKLANEARPIHFHRELETFEVRDARELSVREGLLEELRRANAELEAFSYSMSHDLRAPLRSIVGFSQVLLEDHAAGVNSEGRRHLERVRDAARQMDALICDLLELSRLGRAPILRANVDLSNAANRVFERLRIAEPDRVVEVTVEPDLLASLDPAMVNPLLDHLIGNAWKFTSKKAIARIEVGRVHRPGEDAFFVRDDGAGFDMAYSKKLFSVFQRLHSVRDFEGTGVGLATVQRIVLRHGGQLWAESRLGEGSTFYFSLGEPERGAR